MAVTGVNECVSYVNVGEGFVRFTSSKWGWEYGRRGWELMLIPEYGRDGSERVC